MFLFNDFAGEAGAADMRPLSDEVAGALIRAKQARPGLRVIVITDPINHLYGGIESGRIAALEAAGVEVVMTRLERLRDSNPLWSGLWRVCCQWFGNSMDGGWLPNPVGPGEVSLRTWMRLVNFKANHRKTLVADTPDGWVGLVTSGNPHDGSSAHGNVAIEFKGQAVLDLLATEQAVAAFSAPELQWPEPPVVEPAAETQALRIQVLTEAGVRDAALAAIDEAGQGDHIDLAIFYLSHRGIVESLKDARARGATVRVLLDSNEDAFGKKKNGIPNRSAAWELTRARIDVRWCNTTGEQCHSKYLSVRTADGQQRVLAGSANFTRRNLDNLNLETSVQVAGSAAAPFMRDAQTWFEQRWSNAQGRAFSLPYETHADESRFRYWQYRVMEFSGLSTF
jgi:phosphatidylserine/phosphatidylglycerophosphate/cardiolipin synthase-like enzyme